MCIAQRTWLSKGVCSWQLGPTWWDIGWVSGSMWTWGVMPAITWVTFPMVYLGHFNLGHVLSSPWVYDWLFVISSDTFMSCLQMNSQEFVICKFPVLHNQSKCHFLGTCWPPHLWSWVLSIMCLISPLVASLGGWASQLEGGIFWKQGFPRKASIFTCYSCGGSHSKILGWSSVGRWACKVSEHSQSEFQLPFKQKPSKYLGLSKQECSILHY